MRTFAGVLIGAALLAGSALGADLTGMWVGQLPPARNGGATTDISFQFIQKGTTLSGKLYGDYKSAPIIEGQINGEQIVFFVISPEQAGNQLNEARLKFSGAIKNGEIELTRERQVAANAGNGAAAPNRNSVPQTFRLRRLL